METEQIKEDQDEKPKRTPCRTCHGMGYIERPNGDTLDCPVVSCENGYIKARDEKK